MNCCMPYSHETITCNEIEVHGVKSVICFIFRLIFISELHLLKKKKFKEKEKSVWKDLPYGIYRKARHNKAFFYLMEAMFLF